MHHCTEQTGALPLHVFLACKKWLALKDSNLRPRGWNPGASPEWPIILVPGMRLELTRLWLRPLKAAWLPITPPGQNLVRDKRFELLTTVESGRDSATELITQKREPNYPPGRTR